MVVKLYVLIWDNSRQFINIVNETNTNMIDNCMLNWGDRQNKIFNTNEIQTSKLKQVNLYIYIYV